MLTLANPAQASEIAKLNEQFHLDIPDFRWDTLAWVEEQIRLGNYFITADEQGVTGALCLLTHDDAGVIEAMAVRSDLHGTGVGRLLVDEAQAQSIERGLKTLVVESFCAYGVQGFYEKCGFIRAEELQQFHGHDYYCFSMTLPTAVA